MAALVAPGRPALMGIRRVAMAVMAARAVRVAGEVTPAMVAMPEMAESCCYGPIMGPTDQAAQVVLVVTAVVRAMVARASTVMPITLMAEMVVTEEMTAPAV